MKNESTVLLFFCIILILTGLNGQQIPEHLYSFPVPEQLAVALDGHGNIILSTPDGEIQKFNPAGSLLHTFSPSTTSQFIMVDARFSMQLRAFDENSQQLIYLDRFLNHTRNIPLPPEHFTFINALSWSASGHTLWVFDAADRQIKKWRTDTREIVSALRLDQIVKGSIDVKLLQEYQHKLYLFGSGNLWIFDQLGNFDKELPLPEWKDIAFSGDELMCLMEGNIVEIISLYSPDSKRKISFPSDPSYHKLLMGKNEFFLFTHNAVDVYRSRP